MKPRSRSRRLLAIGVLACLAVAGIAHAASVALPEDDPFYKVPKHVGKRANGAVLRSRVVQTVTQSIPMPADSWQVKYKSTNVHGKPTAVVETIMVPTAPWLGNGPRPLISYQTAEDGVGSKCSPSYGLRAGLEAGSSNSEQETTAMAVALARGISVVAPDYEGPRSEFIGAGGEARAVLDGVRAAKRFKPAGVTKRTKIGLWGYSGGALATSLAAQLQPRYAPKLKFAGIALGGVVADLKQTLLAFSGSAFGGALVVGFVGANRSYPQMHLKRYFNAAGRAAMANSQTDCINDAVNKYPLLKFEDFAKDPAALDKPKLTRFLKRVSPLGRRGTPTAPVYDYHAVLDELAPIGPDRKLMSRYCRRGVKVQHVEDYTSDHVSLVATGAPGALGYLADRFDGKPAPSNC